MRLTDILNCISETDIVHQFFLGSWCWSKPHCQKYGKRISVSIKTTWSTFSLPVVKTSQSNRSLKKWKCFANKKIQITWNCYQRRWFGTQFQGLLWSKKIETVWPALEAERLQVHSDWLLKGFLRRLDILNLQNEWKSFEMLIQMKLKMDISMTKRENKKTVYWSQPLKRNLLNTWKLTSWHLSKMETSRMISSRSALFWHIISWDSVNLRNSFFLASTWRPPFTLVDR